VEGTLQLHCKVCGAGIKVPVGKPLTDAQCSYGCYEIYPEVISWDARLQRLRFHRSEAVALIKKYHTYDRLVKACQRLVAHEKDGKIHVDVILPANVTPAKRSRKRIPAKS
jgi:hypothetical protein